MKTSIQPHSTYKISDTAALVRVPIPLLSLFSIVPLSYFCALGPATPAPITPGSSSCPMLNSSPIPQLTVATMAIDIPASSQNGTLTSFFEHAGPAHSIVFTPPLPSPRETMVFRHWHTKHESDVLLCFRYGTPCPEQLFVASTSFSRLGWQTGRMPGLLLLGAEEAFSASGVEWWWLDADDVVVGEGAALRGCSSDWTSRARRGLESGIR